MKKIRVRKKSLKKIKSIKDMIPFAWNLGLEVPLKAMSHEDMANKYPHLMVLFALHEGLPKSHSLIKANADILKKFKNTEILQMTKEEFLAAGIKL